MSGIIFFYKAEELPKHARTCGYMKDRAKFFAQIKYMGRNYYLPVTKEMKRFFGLSVKNGHMVCDRELPVDSFLRDLIASVYLQVRDTVGSEISAGLSRQITDGLASMFEKKLDKAVEDGLTQKLLEQRTNTDPLFDDLH
jgi:hypothetical protein